MFPSKATFARRYQMTPTYNTILEAAERLAGHAFRTPLLRNDILDERVGARVFIKAENLQRTGSFKFRGAYNAVSAHADAARARGIVASSSGNHAQGVAEAARLFGAKATIVMPSDAPALKKERTMRSGATIVEYDRATEDRDALLDRIAAETGALSIHPYENPYVISGQGTVGLEIVEQLKEYGANAGPRGGMRRWRRADRRYLARAQSALSGLQDAHRGTGRA